MYSLSTGFLCISTEGKGFALLVAMSFRRVNTRPESAGFLLQKKAPNLINTEV